MKKIAHLIACFILFFTFAFPVFAGEKFKAYAKADHIYLFSKIKKQTIQVTHSGVSHDPVLSPNEKWLVFVRRSNHLIPRACAFSLTKTNYADEVLIVDLNTMHKKILVNVHPDCDHPKKVIIDPNDLQFSPDSKTLYFATSAWATSGAIHAIDVDGKNLRYVTYANEYHVIQNGKYRGDLIAYQHRYHDKGGSYDWDWLFTPQGKQIKLYKKEN